MICVKHVLSKETVGENTSNSFIGSSYNLFIYVGTSATTGSASVDS